MKLNENMSAKVLPYRAKKSRPVVDWDWKRFDLANEETEIPVLGTVAAGLPIEALPRHETISVPKDMVGRFETYALKVEGSSMVDENISITQIT